MDARVSLLKSGRGLALMLSVTLCGVAIGAHIATGRILVAAGVSDSTDGVWWTPSDLVAASVPLSRFGVGQVATAWLLGVGVALVFSASVLAVTVLLLKKVRSLDTYGTARWATRHDIVAAGLLDGTTNGQSLIVGGWKAPKAPAGAPAEFLVHTGPESVAYYAPSRSGKTVSVVVPNLLCYESSVFVLDIKGELWEQTAGYRKEELDQHVFFHDPGRDEFLDVAAIDPATGELKTKGACFNPLAEIDIHSRSAVKEVQMLMEYLIPANKKEETSNSSHFEASARSLAVGIFLYEMALGASADAEGTTTIPAVLSAITEADRPIKDYLIDMRNFDGAIEPVSRAIQQIASEMLQREDREFSGVFSSLVTPLSIFRDPILAHATSRSDFRITDLVTLDKPCSFYLTIRPSDRDRLRNYFGLIVNLVCRKLTDSLGEAGKQRHELCLMLDEFSSLPPLPVVQQSMDVMPGYGVKAFIVLQDYETLQALYGEHETISSNCRIQGAYTPSKPKTAKFLSELTGSSTVRQESSSEQKKALGAVPTTHTDTEGFHQRALLTPDEVMRLGTVGVDDKYRLIRPGEALIFARGCYPIRGVQTPFFMNPDLAARASHPPPRASDTPNRPNPANKLDESIVEPFDAATISGAERKIALSRRAVQSQGDAQSEAAPAAHEPDHRNVSDNAPVSEDLPDPVAGGAHG